MERTRIDRAIESVLNLEILKKLLMQSISKEKEDIYS